MALITCKKCGQQMSDRAQVCPHCGAIVKKGSSVVLPLILGIVAYGVLPFILLLIDILLDALNCDFFERIWMTWVFRSFPFSYAISAAVVSMFIAKLKQDRFICLIVPIAIYGILTGLVELFDHYNFYEYRFFIGILEFLIGLGVVVFAAVRRKKYNKVA